MIENLAQLFIKSRDEFGDKPAFGTKTTDKKFQTISYSKLYDESSLLARALISIGVEAKEHVGIFCDNRQEWILADMAIILAGAADVPRGSDVTDADIEYITNHAGIKVLFLENDVMVEKVLRLKSKLPNLKTIIVMEKNSIQRENVYNLYDLIYSGRKLLQNGDSLLEKRIQGIQKEDLFTLIYTSGTTGAPKGVMLTHASMVSQVRSIQFDLDSDAKILSILPVWHIFERVFEMIAISKGCCTYYTNVRSLKEDLQIVKPNFMASAPRLWESIYQGIMANVEKAPLIRKKLFELAYFISSLYQGAIRFLNGKELNLENRGLLFSFFQGIFSLILVILFFFPNLILDQLVLSKIRKATGGALKGSVSGGGALPYHIDLFFNNIGIPVLEGYGLTETCPVISVRTLENLVIGTVGPLYGDIQLRLIDLKTGELITEKGKKGEIHVKGSQVMKGYYKNPEATEKVLKDGWLNTGDIGIMTYNNCLKIVGRSKETIVLLGGENVEPVPVENKILESPFISQCMLVGQDKKYLSILIIIHPEAFTNIGNNYEDLKENTEVKKRIQSEIKRLINAENGFKAFERVVEFRILPKPFEVGDELTAKLSVKRHVVMEKYKKEIESIYKD